RLTSASRSEFGALVLAAGGVLTEPDRQAAVERRMRVAMRSALTIPRLDCASTAITTSFSMRDLRGVPLTLALCLALTYVGQRCFSKRSLRRARNVEHRRAAMQSSAWRPQVSVERTTRERLSIAGALLAVYLIWGSTYYAIHVALAWLPPFLMAGPRFVLAGV